ncbi:MAG TPA: SRPBCC family protein [Polyangia bacterium]|nr:SRPBCC family protein [Polyangia bacterium]
MYLLERETIIPAPLEQVFPFFADARNLERITPDALKFRILTEGPIEMRAGAVIDYRLSLSGLPFRWRTIIEVWDPPHRFVDVQAKGPYKLWRHTHSFEPLPDGTTRMRDRVEYALPFGPLGRLVRRLFVGRQLDAIFAFRQKVIADVFRSA